VIRVGVVGGTGYTGVELLSFLSQHPEVQIDCITSRQEAGIRVDSIFPSLRGHVDLSFSEPDVDQLSDCELVFFATPNGVAMQQASQLLDAGVRIIDLSADFRIKDVDQWQRWYGMTHACPHLLDEAVYGLPEVHREQIKNARLIANPGCYPTAVQLGYLPLIENNLIDRSTLIADTKSGVSGAGRKADIGIAYAEVTDSLKAYGAAGHRHHPEIVQGLSQAAGEAVRLTFVPHLVPMTRGIHATLYGRMLKPDTDLAEVQRLCETRYQAEPFVDVMPLGSHPETRSVRGANVCRIAIHRPLDAETLVILAVEDNLVKGAVGQAVQNMNIVCGFEETTAIVRVPVLP